MTKIGARMLMQGKEYDESNTIGGHICDIPVSNGFKICYNPHRRAWVLPGKKLVSSEQDAKRKAQDFKELVEAS